MRHFFAQMMTALVFTFGLTQAVFAVEYIVLEGPVSDRNFYRAVACAAKPNAPCQKPVRKWASTKDKPISIGFKSLSANLKAYQMRIYEGAMSDVITQINTSGANLWLELDETAPQIAVHILETEPGQIIDRPDLPLLHNVKLPLGLVAVRTDEEGYIIEAAIGISDMARRNAIPSVLLEEVVQALGLLTDIQSKAPIYRRSIFAEHSNSGTRLIAQDAMALRRHYASE